jgi:uncharacterized damage-inducible protein DinB
MLIGAYLRYWMYTVAEPIFHFSAVPRTFLRRSCHDGRGQPKWPIVKSGAQGGTKMPEAWLSGPIDGVDPYLMPAAHALVQVRDEVVGALAGLTPEQLSSRPDGAASVGFHAAHLAGSLDRLFTYARGEGLSPEQQQALHAEKQGVTRECDVLIALVRDAVARALEQLRATPPERLLDARTVGRAGLPSNVLGLLFHAAEHAQRHAGQIATTVKIVRARPTGT